ncbi:MAG: hypothetical protein IJ710_03585, partial [Prevotella sp.]|nr:hypothetical protein [Prevotella sp.]
MKKIFTLIAAAFVALSVNAQTELSLGAGWDTSLEDVVLTGNVEFNYKNSYAAVNLISESFNVADYPSYELVLAAGTPTESLQFCVNENAWSGSFGAGVTTPTAFVPDGVTEITSIQLQACDVANLGKVEIIEFNLIDAQGGKHPTNYQVPPSWAADVVTPIKNATVSFTSGGAWTFANINGANGLSNQTITI